jgi:hypothetical protein
MRGSLIRDAFDSLLTDLLRRLQVTIFTHFRCARDELRRTENTTISDVFAAGCCGVRWPHRSQYRPCSHFQHRSGGPRGALLSPNFYKGATRLRVHSATLRSLDAAFQWRTLYAYAGLARTRWLCFPSMRQRLVGAGGLQGPLIGSVSWALETNTKRLQGHVGLSSVSLMHQQALVAAYPTCTTLHNTHWFHMAANRAHGSLFASVTCMDPAAHRLTPSSAHIGEVVHMITMRANSIRPYWAETQPGLPSRLC